MANNWHGARTVSSIGRYRIINSLDIQPIALFNSKDFLVLNSESDDKSEHNADSEFIGGVNYKTAILISLVSSFLALLISVCLLAIYLFKPGNNTKGSVTGKIENPPRTGVAPHPDAIQNKHVERQREFTESNISSAEVFSDRNAILPPRFEQVTTIDDRNAFDEVNHEFYVTDYSDVASPGSYTDADFKKNSQYNSYYKIRFNATRTAGKISINTDSNVSFDPLLNNTDRLIDVCEFVPDPSKSYVSIKEIAAGEISVNSGIYTVSKKIKIKLIEG